jgi:hypothetical protein
MLIGAHPASDFLPKSFYEKGKLTSDIKFTPITEASYDGKKIKTHQDEPSMIEQPKHAPSETLSQTEKVITNADEFGPLREFLSEETTIHHFEACQTKIIQSINHGIFPGFTMLIHGFTYKELMEELPGEWRSGLEHDQELIENSTWLAMHRTVCEGESKKELFYIYIRSFNFSDYAFCQLAHECTHIASFFLRNVLDRNQEIEAEAYFHTHIMWQAIKHLRGNEQD